MATGNFEVCPRISPKFGDEDGDSNFGEIPHPSTYYVSILTYAQPTLLHNKYFSKMKRRDLESNVGVRKGVEKL